MNDEKEFGVIAEIYYPLVRVHGLPTVGSGEMVQFETGESGIVFSLLSDCVEILLLDQDGVHIGDRVKPLRTEPNISYMSTLFGVVINPLGNLLIGKRSAGGDLINRKLDTHPAGIAQRAAIDSPFLTGITTIDLMLPLGQGQKELVIGDRKSGKTSVLLTALKNQANAGTKIIYAAIGKKKQDVESIYEFVQKENLSDNTVIVATYSNDSPSLIYLTPFTAMSIAEGFRDQGIPTLVILDDLSTHAKFYREVSLLAGRFPGRESYPGDMFHVHAKLLERSGNFKIGNKAVAITVLPVVEVHDGDLTSHIATNLMSITDGHIFLDSNIFSQGRRPAINISLSVTRVGRQAHSKLVRSITREVNSFLSLYEKMKELSHFGAELTDSVKNILATGDTVYKLLEQERGVVISQKVQVVMFALIWLKAFEDMSKDALINYRNKLVEGIKIGSNMALIDDVVNAESLNDLLANVNKNIDSIKKLCV